MLRRRKKVSPDAKMPVVAQPEVVEMEQNTTIDLGNFVHDQLSRTLGNLRLDVCIEAARTPGMPADHGAIKDLLGSQVDVIELWGVVTGQLAEAGQIHVQQIAQRHKNLLLRQNKVALKSEAGEDGDVVYESIPVEFVDRFEQNIFEAIAKVPEIIPSIEEEPIDEIREFALENCVAIKQASEKIQKMTPDLQTEEVFALAIAQGRGPEWVKSISYGVKPTGGLKINNIQVDERSSEYRKLTRYAKNLLEVIESCAANPTAFLASEMVEFMAPNFNKMAEKAFEDALCISNGTLYEELKIAEKSGNRQTRRQKRIRVAPTLGEQAIDPTLSQPEPTSEEPEHSAEPACAVTHELTVLRTVEAPLSLPWVNDGQPSTFEVQECSDGTSSVFIVRALDSRLQKFAEKVRTKQGSVSAKEYNDIIQLLAYRTALLSDSESGNYKTLSKERAPAFSAVSTIYYNPEIANNAKRVYVTHESSIAPFLSDSSLSLSSEVPVVFVLAEADKQTQLDVLRRITGLNRSTLRSGGAGYV